MPTLDEADKMVQEVEAWILGMERYFKNHDYLEREKDHITIFSLNSRLLI